MPIRPAGWLTALAVAYLAAHLPFLAPSLEDIDSINFALGLRHFDPALHQPHPPGYPVFIALGHASLALVRTLVPALPPVRAEALALAFWSALSGAIAILGAARLFHAAERWRTAGPGSVPEATGWAVGLIAVCPLFWMSGLRPLSDMTGLAAALWAQALALEARHDTRRLTMAAFVAAVAGGIRVQTFALTLPLLLVAAVDQVRRHRTSMAWLVTRPLVAVVVAVAAWGVPLVWLTGGPAAYLAALGSQAGEDFAWVDMLWADPTPRKIAFGLYDTLVLPWGSLPLAVIVGALACLGLVVAWRRARSAFALLLAAFVPYAVFHLLFQEVVSVRYALPVVPLVAWVAMRALTATGRWAGVLAVSVAVSAMAVSITGARVYGHEMHPAFRALAAAERRAAAESPAGSFAHYGLRRALQAADLPLLRFVEPQRQYEWLGPVEYWRRGGTEAVWFFAEPHRTDLALLDPQSLRDVTHYRWAAGQRFELSGTRPRDVDWYRIQRPGWFAGTGWSLTPEAGGIAHATRSGPSFRPIEAWVRRRQGPMHLMIGGRHLGDAAAPDAEISATIDGVTLDRWRLTAGEKNFLRFILLPEGLPRGGEPYASVLIRAQSAGGRDEDAEVAIRQFDVQDAGRLIFGFGEGWHEEEYASDTGLRWRWTSERSLLMVEGPSQAIRLTLRGESPLKYFDSAPLLRVSAGDRTIGELRPAADFEWVVEVPADAWTASGGSIAVSIDRVYLPGPAEGTDDARHLGVRLFETRIDPVGR